MKRYETQLAKDDAILTIMIIMNNASDDESYRGYYKQYMDIISRPVAPDICCYGDCNKHVQDNRSYCEDHHSASWVSEIK